MKQVTQHNKTGEVRVEEVPAPALKPGSLLVRVQSSLISAGTEKASITARKSSLFQKARRQPEQVKKVLEQIKQYGLLPTYRRARALLNTRAPIGYSAAGEVVAVGDDLTDVRAGDRVACAGSTSNHAEYIIVPRNLCVKVPKDVDYEEAAYTTLGAIALQGVRQASVTLGECVVVIGLGLVGQLTVQILKANGCRVVGIDPDPNTIQLAKESGAELALRRDQADVENILHSFTRGIGADAVIITAATPSSDPVKLAGELCRDKGRVVLVGDVGIELPRSPYYMKELDFRLSRSLGPGRYDPKYEVEGHDYPIGFVRWTENRNMQEFLRLVAEGRVDVKKLTTHRFRIEDAPRAYGVISGSKKTERSVGVLLEYEAAVGRSKEKLVRKIDVRPIKGARAPSALNIGFLGAGSFAQGFLIPNVQRVGGARLLGVCTGSGLNAQNVANNYGFQFATTDPREILDNPDIGTVFIAARHNLHARYAVDGLKAGKHVFVEKPLALTDDELSEVVSTYRGIRGPGGKRTEKKGRTGGPDSQSPPLLMVGFNRRFAPHVQHAIRFFEHAVGPYAIQYRVSAGILPSTHWSRDPIEGGGRILGEVCHFVDLLLHITQSLPARVFAEPISPGSTSAPDDDSVAITLKFEDGSIGAIQYVASGDAAVEKERIEMFSTGRTAIIENFQRLILYQQEKRREFKLTKIDKGHREEVRTFLEAVRQGGTSPISFDHIVSSTLTTFKIVESLKIGAPVSVQ